MGTSQSILQLEPRTLSTGKRVGETPEDPILIDAPSAAMAPAPAPAPHSSVPPPLPPSVEAAYKKKCIQLKKRMAELEEANEAALKRKIMNERGIRKLRLQRAVILTAIGTIMKKNGERIEGLPVGEDEDSEGSSEGPPTPHEKPMRSKRSHRRPVNASPPAALHPASSSLAATPRGLHHQQQGYESTFSAHPAYHHQQISPSQAPGYFNPPMPGQQDTFPLFLESFIANNPHLRNLPENRQVNLASEAWGRMSEAQRRQRQSGYVVDEERYNRVEAGLAALRGGAGVETEEATAATAADTSNDHAGDEVKDEGGDEEMEEAKGGFTAVNG